MPAGSSGIGWPSWRSRSRCRFAPASIWRRIRSAARVAVALLERSHDLRVLDERVGGTSGNPHRLAAAVAPQALDELTQVRRARSVVDRSVPGGVERGDLGAGRILMNRALEPLVDAAQLVEVRLGRAVRGPGGRQRLERDANPIHLEDRRRRKFRHHHAVMRRVRDDAVRLEQAQGLPDRRRAHAEPFLQRRYRQALAGLEAPVLDREPHRAVRRVGLGHRLNAR